MFKRLLLSFALFASFAVNSSAQNFTLQGGNFQVAGVPVANGSVILTLSNPSATICVGGGAATPTYTINLDANGNMPLTTVLGNSALCPQGTFYTAQLFTAASGGGTLISTSTWIVGPSAPYSGTLYPNVMVLPAVSFTGGVTVPSATVSFSATPTFNAATVSKFYITLTGNVTSSTLTGSVKDQLVIFAISQDGVGSRTFAWPTNVKGQSIAPGAGLTSTQAFTSDGTNLWPIGEMTVSSGNVDVRGNNGVFGGTVSAAGGVTASSMPAFTGDATTSAGSTVTTVGKVNGVSYPAAPSTHAVPVTTTANTETYKVVPDCTDTTGNHINYTQSTDAWSCGTSVPASVVTASSTTTMSNKALQGAGSGNTVTLLNSQDALTAVTGNGTDQTLYTFTIPANTVQAGKGFRIRYSLKNNNATSLSIKAIIGSTTLDISGTAASANHIQGEIIVTNKSGVQNSQNYVHLAYDGAAILANDSGATTLAENFANAIAVKVTVNVAAANTYTPKLWAVELIQ